MSKDKCVYCGMSKDSKYLDMNQREKYSYDFIHANPGTDLQNNLSKRFFKGDKAVKFDVIIGNPPYQLNDGGNGASATPIYHKFVTQAISLNPRFISMIIPARWYAGGKGLSDFRSLMLNDDSIRDLVDFVNAKDCFPSLSISGGICYFLRDSEYHGPCRVQNNYGGIQSISLRPLSEHGVLIRYNEAIPILQKVRAFNEETLDKQVYSRNIFGFGSDYRGNPEETSECSVPVMSSGGMTYCKHTDIKTGIDLVPEYKVILSYVTAEHAGEPAKDGRFTVTSTYDILKPGEVCTETYLVLFTADSKNLAENYVSYLKTKFYRFLLLLSISSIHLSKDKFQFIPVQDFNHSYTDDDLNAKYGLSDEEIAFIDGLIKEKA